MRIIIPNSLPPFNVAYDLEKLLPKYAPYFFKWLQLASFKSTNFDPMKAGCTAFEAWDLEEHGFVPKKHQKLSSGLGPFLANIHLSNSNKQEQIWLGELGSFLFRQNGSTCNFDPQTMNFDINETKILINSILPYLKEFGFKAQILSAERIRIFIPDKIKPDSVSPLMIAEHGIENILYSQSSFFILWRRLLNHVQIIWHKHPINQKRQEKGLLPINMLWLYGGAYPWNCLAKVEESYILNELKQSYNDEDWYSWLDALSKLDKSFIKSLCKPNGLPLQSTQLFLFGKTRRVILTLSNSFKWIYWFPSIYKNWSFWWSYPV
ncbi:MAG: hypothetical protein IR526_00995 [Bordetella sp.]|nr:MAG: hypothetical protein IR526_00995 [Bordetella sp.]